MALTKNQQKSLLFFHCFQVLNYLEVVQHCVPGKKANNFSRILSIAAPDGFKNVHINATTH
jgi:hypothetical protein